MKTIRRILILVLMMVALQCSLSAQVVIKPETARYFLEADDERFLLREKDSLSLVRIDKLETEIVLRNQIIKNQQGELMTSQIEYNVLVQEINDSYDYTAYVEKQLRKEIRLRNTFGGAAIGATVGSFVGQPLAGALIGGGAGFVVSLFKKKLE